MGRSAPCIPPHTTRLKMANTVLSCALTARYSATMARHTPQCHGLVVLDTCSYTPTFYTCHDDQDSTHASRQEAAAGHTQEVHGHGLKGRDGAGEAHEAESGEEGEEEGAREKEERNFES
jgi:hypothetical protein